MVIRAVSRHKWLSGPNSAEIVSRASVTAHSEISWLNVHPVNYYAHFPIYFRRRVGSNGTALAKEKAAYSKHDVVSHNNAEIRHSRKLIQI